MMDIQIQMQNTQILNFNSNYVKFRSTGMDALPLRLPTQYRRLSYLIKPKIIR